MSNLFSPPTPPNAGSSAPQAASTMARKSFDIVDLKQYFHIVVKRIWLVALCFVIALAVTVVMIVRQVPVYQSTVSILVTSGLPIPGRVKQEERVVLGDYLETQLRIMQSGFLISRARERLNRPSDEIQGKLVRISVEAGWRTSFLYVRVQSLDPVFSADFANAIADEYMAFKAEERLDTAQSTVLSLTQQANRLLEELKKADERVLAYEKENSVVALQERGNIAARSLAGLARQSAGYRTERMLLEAQMPLLSQASDDVALAALMAPVSPIQTPIVSSMASIVREQQPRGEDGDVAKDGESLVERGVVGESQSYALLKRQKVILETRMASLRSKFREEHPAIRQTLEELANTDAGLQMELRFALQQYYTKLEALKLQAQAARNTELAWEDEALEYARKSHEYQNLLKDVNRLTSLYDLLFNRLKDVDVSIGIEPESIRVMERAVPSYAPVTPRKLQTIFLAAVVGLGIGLVLVFGLEYVDDSIRYPEEVQRSLGLQFLGVVPAANWDPGDLRTHLLSNIDQKSGLAEAYRNIRSAVLFSAGQDKLKVIAVTSAVPKEGKTTTCLNMAISLAQAGLRVLVVDADMRRGELHKFYGLEGGRGLADVLVGQAKPESVIQRTGLPNLDLVATGPFPPNPAEIILHGEFNAFLEYAKRTYDHILLDCPPIMAVSEASTVATLADKVIMVVWAGQTSRKLTQLAVQVMQQRGATIMGCVLNNLEFARVGYYYYSTYYGYYNYNYRYDQT
ncbi:MAG: polysaccharide biosynthesis tyrosine autokinase [bacterium]